MACGERQTITVTHWGVCWEWIFPYPCKKTTHEIRYQYDFRPWRTRFSWLPFRNTYQGCCGGALFQWSYWTWSPFGTGNGPWVDTTMTYFSDGLIGSTDKCPFGETGIGISTSQDAMVDNTPARLVTPALIVAALVLLTAMVRATRRPD